MKNGSTNSTAVFLFGTCKEVSAKQGRNAPETCKTDNSVNDPGDQRILSAKEPGNKVKLE
jgi:hypothetical protein